MLITLLLSTQSLWYQEIGYWIAHSSSSPFSFFSCLAALISHLSLLRMKDSWQSLLRKHQGKATWLFQYVMWRASGLLYSVSLICLWPHCMCTVCLGLQNECEMHMQIHMYHRGGTCLYSVSTCSCPGKLISGQWGMEALSCTLC